MQTASLEQLRQDTAGVIAAAQAGNVLLTNDGKIVAILSKAPGFDFEAYWKEREQRLAGLQVAPNWDSTTAVSEDRDRT